MTISTAKTAWLQDAQGRWWMPKDPDATLDYSLDWSKWLAQIADTIASVTVVLSGGTELTVVSHGFDGGVTTATISGGATLASMQSVTFRVTTANGRIDDRTVYLQITER